MRISQYETYLKGCRFCTMCTPFGEVWEIVKDEPHCTRIRALILWQILKGYAEWNEDVARLLYETTLDSVSQAWCINHYPVPEYILAARADIFEAGFAPETVSDYSVKENLSWAHRIKSFAKDDSDTVLYPGDSIAANDVASTEAILKVFLQNDQHVSITPELLSCGGLAYCLGKHEQAKHFAKKVVHCLEGYSKIIVDGPLSYWMLTQIYPSMGIEFPERVEISIIYDYLNEFYCNQDIHPTLDGRYIYLLGSEFSRLTAVGYGPLKKLFDCVNGFALIEPKDGLEYASGSGVGGALHIACPALARRVSQQRIVDAIQSGADYMICDSPLDASHLRSVSKGELQILTLPEWLQV